MLIYVPLLCISNHYEVGKMMIMIDKISCFELLNEGKKRLVVAEQEAARNYISKKYPQGYYRECGTEEISETYPVLALVVHDATAIYNGVGAPLFCVPEVQAILDNKPWDIDVEYASSGKLKDYIASCLKAQGQD